MFMILVRDTLAYLSLPWAFHPPRYSLSDFSNFSKVVADGKNVRPEWGVHKLVVPRMCSSSPSDWSCSSTLFCNPYTVSYLISVVIAQVVTREWCELLQ